MTTSNMKKTDNIEDELDAIRIELYEQTKDMSSDERIAYLRSLAAPIHEELGIKPVSDPLRARSA